MALNVPAVLQAQRPELFIRQLAGQIAFELVAELRRAGVHELSVEIGVLVHEGAEVGRMGGARNDCGFVRTLGIVYIFVNDRLVLK
jgi:hypothetical protein